MGRSAPTRMSVSTLFAGHVDHLVRVGSVLGPVTDACYPRHRHGEFLRFLTKAAAAYPGEELRVVCDNYATHKHADVRAWLARPENQRITLHFVPASCSGLNLVECFSVITRQAIRRAAASPPSVSSSRPLTGHRRLHRSLERAPPAVHLYQRCRRDPRQHPARQD
jgi:hypothetical protein